MSTAKMVVLPCFTHGNCWFYVLCIGMKPWNMIVFDMVLYMGRSWEKFLEMDQAPMAWRSSRINGLVGKSNPETIGIFPLNQWPF
jgi:hypothetical protein